MISAVALLASATTAGILITADTAGANAATPTSITGTIHRLATGKVKVTLTGTWNWPGQTCAGRYGEGLTVDWWGISTATTPTNNFKLSTATLWNPTTHAETTTGIISEPPATAGSTFSLKIPKPGSTHGPTKYFHAGSWYNDVIANSATTCTTTTTKGTDTDPGPPPPGGHTKGSKGTFTTTATYPSASDLPQTSA